MTDVRFLSCVLQIRFSLKDGIPAKKPRKPIVVLHYCIVFESERMGLFEKTHMSIRKIRIELSVVTGQLSAKPVFMSLLKTEC